MAVDKGKMREGRMWERIQDRNRTKKSDLNELIDSIWKEKERGKEKTLTSKIDDALKRLGNEGGNQLRW